MERLPQSPASPLSRASVKAGTLPATLPAVLFLLSASSLAFEVLLTRLFSLVFHYHYAFMAVSLAILGLGLGALVACLAPGVGRDPALGTPKVYGIQETRIALAVSLSLPLAALLFGQLTLAGGLALRILVGLVPFSLIGLFSARVYAQNSERGARLYAADLAGAAVGLVLALFWLDWQGAVAVAFLLGILSALAALLLAPTGRLRAAAVLAAVFFTVALFAGGRSPWISRDLLAGTGPSASMAAAPPDKVMFHVLADPAQQARIVDTAWNSFARVDLVQTADPNQMYVFSDAGAGSFMIRFDGDLEEVGWLKEQVEYLPFLTGPVDSTLVLGAGAGKDVLQALLAGSRDIVAVEINPAMLAMTRRFAAYNGSILDRPGVTTVTGEGRNFVERSREQYDLIYLNLVYSQASEVGSAALSESYIFTEEAFIAYWQHLSPQGRLAVVSHQALEGSRALLTAIASLAQEGLRPSEVLRRAVLVMYPAEDPNQRLSVMILSKEPWTEVELLDFTQESIARGLQALYVPGFFEMTMRGLTGDEISLEEFITGDDYNLFPTRDDRPFFFHLNRGLPIPLKSSLWVVSLAVVGFLALMGLGRLGGFEWGKTVPTVWQTTYFGLIGAGFMFIEVPLIQRHILLFGSPVLALIVVLGSLLVSAGLGSLISGRWPEDRLLSRVAWAALAAAVISLSLAIFQPRLVLMLLKSFNATGTLHPFLNLADNSLRILITCLTLAPLGLALGVPFASGLRLAGQRQPGSVAWLWGWNALSAVLGSVLSAVIAITAGFTWALLLGTACYAALAGLAAFAARLRNA
jgi:spermidine synthase